MARPRKQSHVAAAVAAAMKEQQFGHFPAEPLPYVDLGYVAFGFIAPEPPISVNKTNGRNFRVSHLHKLAWETTAATAAREHAELLAPFQGFKVKLTFALPVTRPTQCDASNFAGGISCKAAQDGITRTGLLIPDDNSRWLDTSVVFWLGGETKDLVRVKIEVAPNINDPGLW